MVYLIEPLKEGLRKLFGSKQLSFESLDAKAIVNNLNRMKYLKITDEYYSRENKESFKIYRIITRKLGSIFTRYPTEPLDERLKSARYIILDYRGRESSDWLSVEKRERLRLVEHGMSTHLPTSSHGYVTYVDKDGNRVYAYADKNRESVEIYGFDLKKSLAGIGHEAHEGDGIIVSKLGAMWRATTTNGKEVVGECYNMAKIGNIIFSTTGDNNYKPTILSPTE